jgi:hypothetical protein
VILLSQRHIRLFPRDGFSAVSAGSN